MKSDPPVEIFPSVLDPHMNEEMRIEDFVPQAERDVFDGARVFRKLPLLFRQLRIRDFPFFSTKNPYFSGVNGTEKVPL